MDKYEAQEIVRNTFQNPFDKGRFSYFIKNLLNHIDESKAFHAHGYVQEKYKQVAGIIRTYERIGTYTDPEGNKIDVLIVYLTKEDSIERARTTLRNYAADYLKNRGEKNAGLFAFVPPDQKDWRFSFVKMEYRLTETPSKRIKAHEEFTPAKRYSFLVGENESSHTAQSQLVPIIQDDINNPTLKQLEDAFNIESVTKEFFTKYRELFLLVKEALEEIIKTDERIKSDFTNKQINTNDFAKKLLGQIVFLYFLQKKGWFGVERDKDWGTGSKDFLRRLFEKMIVTYDNYFNDILEPLFYEALARERDDNFYSRFNCKIPFLNGGLFDPICNYDWVHTDILLPNELFSNNFKTKEGDLGTGILDIFDRYNFTVKEDEPLEKEVAIDPEMLGKVFENLLEVKDRKSKGTYYTPREIVHYMCQESLINYLETECEGKVNREEIETLIKYGETVIEHDNRVGQNGIETSTYSYKIPESIRKNASLIDEKLGTVRVCDPAIGSGAFPVGMMNEIIRTRNALTNYLNDKTNRTIYDFKRHAIQNCLYGVDIDLGAVEIAKLRLWLSLVVDEEDIISIKPLPNLDYKIVCGNSLLNIDKGGLFTYKWFEELEKIKPIYFEETNINKKREIRRKIDDLIREITNNNTDFDFEVYFSEVFHEKKGFDIVIGNPPWEKVKPQDPEFFRLYDGDYRKKSKNEQEEIRKKLLKEPQVKREYDFFINSRYKIMHYASKHYKYQGSSDLNYYKLFIEKSLEVSHMNICWVVPGSITIDEGSFNLRQYLLKNRFITEIIGFSNKEKVFEWVDNNQKFIVLSLLKKTNSNNFYIYGWLPNAENLNNIRKIKIDCDLYKNLDSNNLTLYIDSSPKSFILLEKFHNKSNLKPLRDLKFHYWQEYHGTNDASYFNDKQGKFILLSGKAIDQFDCMAKTWLENHGRSSKWKKMTFPKKENEFRTEYFVSNIPNRIVEHHNKVNSNFRIMVQDITGTINNIRTVYACVAPNMLLSNNTLHNLYIGRNDNELLYYLGILNSFIVDWQARIKVATHLNRFVLESFFFPDYELADVKLRERLCDISYWLSNVCSDFKDIERNFSPVEFHTREDAIAEVNAIAAKLYELDFSELQFVLSYFDLVDDTLKEVIVKKFKEIT